VDLDQDFGPDGVARPRDEGAGASVPDEGVIVPLDGGPTTPLDEVAVPVERRAAAVDVAGADEALVAALTSPGGLAAFVSEVGRVLDIWLVDIWAFDRERDSVVYEAVWRRDGASATELAAVGTRVALSVRPDLGLVLQSRALVARHIDDPDLSRDVAAVMKRRGYRSCYDVPLFDGRAVVGVLGLVERRAVRRLNDAELALLGRACRLAALGVQAAWERRVSDERADCLLALVESGQALAATFGQGEILGCFRDMVARLLPGVEHEVQVWLRREDDWFVPMTSDAEGLPRGDVGGPPPALALKAMARHRPAQSRLDGEPTRLIVPLVVSGEGAGYIDIHGRPLLRFSPEELAVLQVLADHVAVALELKRLGRSLDRQAAVDSVTGFFNRWYFYERLYSETARANRYKQPLSVVLVGIDGFEKFVVGRGKLAGDAVLRAIGRLLTASLRRKVDVACVHGVGEFALLLPSTPPVKPGAALVAQRLRAAIAGMELRDEEHGLLGRFTLSVGVAGFPRHAEDADELAGYVVEALAQARALGGDRVQVWGAPPDAFLDDGSDDGEVAVVVPSPNDSISALILPPDWDD
jgi:diguanylate cyclase (GGDEF)-like protein